MSLIIDVNTSKTIQNKYLSKLLVSFLVSSIIVFIAYLCSSYVANITFTTYVINYCISNSLLLASFFILHNLNDKHITCTKILLNLLKFCVKYCLLVIVVCIASYLGSCFLLVPGLIIAIRWSMFPYILINEQCGLTSVLRRSWQLTNNCKLPIFVSNLLITITLFFPIGLTLNAIQFEKNHCPWLFTLVIITIINFLQSLLIKYQFALYKSQLIALSADHKTS